MRFPNFKHPLMAFVGVLALLLVASLSSGAEENASTLSGHVVDMEGHPVSELTLGIQPIDMIEGEMWQMPTPMQQSRTDAAGNFRINDIVPGRAKLVVVPKTGTFESDKEIHAIEIGGLRFLPIDHPNARVFVSMIDGKWRIGTPERLQRVGIALLEKEVDRLDKPLENR